uniref:Uncharacterized protein n=1 Tax=Rangifer tarandus platyrhynchus TaxID=3082113 RepID=A0ACB0ESK1_RANTA|nr:unnamed protein product [Rangifer tarandus platyrhynchus]
MMAPRTKGRLFVKLLGTRFHSPERAQIQRLNVQVQQRLRLPPTLQEGHRNRFRGTTPWHSALPGRARSAVRATALLRGCHRKTGASPELPQVTKRHSPRRQGFRSDPAVRPSKLRAGADTRGRPKDGTGALPLLRLCEVAD